MNRKKLLSAFAFVGCMIIAPTSFSQETESQDHEHHNEVTYDWVKIETQNGITISYAIHYENGRNYLKVLLENTTNEFIEVIWALHNGNNEIINETSVQLWENGSQVYDETDLIPVQDGSSLNDFKLTIKKINKL